MRWTVSFTTTLLLAPAVCVGTQAFVDGPKLVGTPTGATALQGIAVALSADGTTALVGGDGDDGSTGATWVFTRANGHWSQQTKLIALTGTNALQGRAVALSADGSTALVGAPGEGNGAGAVWVFTRSNGVWTPTGQKLLPNDASAGSAVGSAVALSPDGQTALIGGPGDVQNAVAVGAAWIYTRSGSTWTQGTKLVGSVKGTGVPAAQGAAVALSADAATAFVGGPAADSGNGSVWVFVQSSGTWSLQERLFGSLAGDQNGAAQFGASVSASADGNTVIIGGPHDASNVGAAWVWVRGSGSLPWSVQGPKLLGGGESGPGWFGASVSMSADGSSALVGGPLDGSQHGAAWAFTRSGGAWSQVGAKLLGSGVSGSPPFAQQGDGVALSTDGSTALVGGPLDAFSGVDGIGAAWVFTRACLGPSGDVNGSGAVDVSDVFYLINFLFAGGQAPVCR